MASLLYQLFLLLYQLGVRIAALRSEKARQWLAGRRHKPEIPPADKTIWMHCASLGEFEQGRPVLEGLKKEYPGYRFIVSFFSPSGYEIRKDYPGADIICYLPMDSPSAASQFLDMANPALVIWIKYDYWYYFLREINRRKIPLLLVSAVFRSDQAFFRFYGSLWRKMLGYFSRIFVQNEDSLELLQQAGLAEHAERSGDTRFDRVAHAAESKETLSFIESFCHGRKVLVAGSTWEEDEEELFHFSNTSTEVAFIIAPHLVDQENIRDVSKRFRNSICYSQLIKGEQAEGKNVLIIDNIGMLSRLYQYADVSYVGGGFGNDGIHNILEPAAYGKPVIIGPVHDKFFEARELIEAGGCFSVKNALELETLLNKLLNDPNLLQQAGSASSAYVKKNKGATEVVLRYIQANRLLIS